jgi:hypothetical protein
LILSGNFFQKINWIFIGLGLEVKVFIFSSQKLKQYSAFAGNDFTIKSDHVVTISENKVFLFLIDFVKHSLISPSDFCPTVQSSFHLTSNEIS